MFVGAAVALPAGTALAHNTLLSSDPADGAALAVAPTQITMWLEMMIAHHEGAVSQSRTVKANGSNADVLTLADTIINAQQAEIAEMQALLQS